MAEQVPQAVAGRTIAQVVQNPQPAQDEPAVAQQAQDQPLAQQAQNQEVCIFFMEPLSFSSTMREDLSSHLESLCNGIILNGTLNERIHV